MKKTYDEKNNLIDIEIETDGTDTPEYYNNLDEWKNKVDDDLMRFADAILFLCDKVEMLENKLKRENEV